jgi:CTP:molybdopterin cytidylyltransferase MocA
VTRAVVIAAGEGRRLRPLTGRWPKPLLPIDGRPVIATLLRELAAAAVTEVTLVTGHLAEQLERFVGGGTAFGVDVRFVRQPDPNGSADALLRALEGGAELPVVLAGADTLFTPGDLARFVDAARGERLGALAVRRRPPPDGGKTPVEVANGAVVRAKGVDPASTPLGGAPLWWLGSDFRPFLDGVPGPPYELVDALEAALGTGGRVSAIEIGPTRDLTYPEDLVRENFPYVAAS